MLRVFEFLRAELKIEWKELNNEELHNLNSSSMSVEIWK
jgi:hypothetical protein